MQLRKIWGRIPPNSKLLLAVSGGMDSMVLLDVFSKSPFQFEVAHCNFQLRGKDSEDDAKLAQARCSELGALCHVKTFDLKELFPEKGIQEAARMARYAWFETLRKERSLDFVLTAHHEMDQAETMIFNFIRGAGIRGLRGMKTADDTLLRPLLDVSKSDIFQYQQSENVVYREDQSNASTVYSRNKIRNTLLPQLKELNPGVVETLSRQGPLFEEVATFLEKHLLEIEVECVEQKGDERWIDLAKLQASGLPFHGLQHLLSPYGFSPSQIRACVELVGKQSGKSMESHDWKVIKDRQHLVVLRREQEENTISTIGNLDDFQGSPIHAQLVETSEVNFGAKEEAWVDFDKIAFPLQVRRWKAGDCFQPLGMKGTQKISDFLTHQHLPSGNKKDQLVVCTGDHIIWVVGMRIHDAFKVNENTRRVLHLKARKD